MTHRLGDRRVGFSILDRDYGRKTRQLPRHLSMDAEFNGDYKQVDKGGVNVRLPHRLVDQRGKGRDPREFGVRWSLNVRLPTELFVKPRLSSEEDPK